MAGLRWTGLACCPRRRSGYPAAARAAAGTERHRFRMDRLDEALHDPDPRFQGGGTFRRLLEEDVQPEQRVAEAIPPTVTAQQIHLDEPADVIERRSGR